MVHDLFGTDGAAAGRTGIQTGLRYSGGSDYRDRAHETHARWIVRRRLARHCPFHDQVSNIQYLDIVHCMAKSLNIQYKM